MNHYFSLLIFIFLIVSSSCIEQDGKNSINKDEKTRDEKRANNTTISFQKDSGKSVFYGLYSPNEISEMLKSGGMRYRPESFLSAELANEFTSSSKIAANLGIYGADFSMTKMFNDPEAAIRYMGAINRLSEKLGIPAAILESSALRIEQNIGDIDSLSNIAMEVFAISTDFLLENGRESALGLILMGGWIEGMYQALNIIETDSIPDPQLVEMIMEQKYALNFLLTFLKNQYEDPDVAYYYRLLEVLADHFGRMEIYYHPGGVEVDTSKQLITTKWSQFDYSISAIEDIKQIVSGIRAIVTET